jgi:transposase-like protein
MLFPISTLMSQEESIAWLTQHFHPEGIRCPSCHAASTQARLFRTTRRGLVDWRCKICQRVYNLYSGTVFEGSSWSPVMAVLLLRGICKGESSKALAAELGVSRTTVILMRQRIQANGYATRAQQPLPAAVTETDEAFQNAGGKASRIATPLIRHAVARTNAKGTALTK